MAEENEKRGHSGSSEDEWVGPMPSEAAKTKKRKVLDYESVYLENLPCAASYETSYMHRDIVTHLAVTKSGFLVTASCDGHVKFWRKNEEQGIEFVKHFRSHLGNIQDLAISENGEFCCTISDDETMKIFDVLSFDMINMVRLGYVPLSVGWVCSPGDPVAAIAVSEKVNGKIHVYDSQGAAEPLMILERLHSSPVRLIKYNTVYNTAISIDSTGMLEYWSGHKTDFAFPKNVAWEYKTDTDLYEFAKCKTVPTGLAFSPDGKLFATISKDRQVRVFKFLTGKLHKVLDERLQRFSELQQMKQQLPNMEFGKRMAVERDLEKSDAFSFPNLVFDESGNFLLYPTMLGIKVINLVTNRCMRILGKPENSRFLQIALFQGSMSKPKAAVTVEMEASDNPKLLATESDPTLFCTAFKRNRFYIISRREPDDVTSGGSERDIFNEKPSKEELAAATQDSSYSRVSENAIIHTSLGDIHLKLCPKECPKTVENFCVHSKNGYYNGHIFHRVIKGFMIQTGDPLGNGSGGESIWGGEFEDEFHPLLKHDKPYTLSMANAGPNTNGSQFFITVSPSTWLDNKHTVFGRVVKGMEVVQKISMAKTNPKTDKPHDDISIVSVTVK